METGTYISIAGHALLIGWAFFGIHRNPDPLPFEVQSVSVVTGAEFETILAAQRPPEVAAQPAALTPPPETTATPDPAPQLETTPQATPVTP
ncbi:MAG: energy transducer TonB, partial [Rhodobacteraceae bacterium]